MNAKGFTYVILIVVAAIIIGILGFFVVNDKTKTPQTQQTSDQNQTQQPPQQLNTVENKFGIVSFTKDDAAAWPLEWHITLSPEDIKNSEFQIISQLKTEKPSDIENTLGFDENILSDILVDKREIQPGVGDPVDIKFRLASESRANPNGPRGYQYIDMAAGFSRLGGFIKGTIPNPVTPYGTSFPIFMLGNKVIDRSFKEEGNFKGSKILIGTINTSDNTNAYTYEFYLEKFTIKREISQNTGFTAEVTGSRTVTIAAPGIFYCIPSSVRSSSGMVAPDLLVLADNQGVRENGITFSIPIGTPAGTYTLATNPSPFPDVIEFQVRAELGSAMDYFNKNTRGTLTIDSMPEGTQSRTISRLKGGFDFETSNSRGELVKIKGYFDFPAPSDKTKYCQ